MKRRFGTNLGELIDLASLSGCADELINRPAEAKPKGLKKKKPKTKDGYAH
jgi:hypothetical protein